jgi:hypothetical protein
MTAMTFSRNGLCVVVLSGSEGGTGGTVLVTALSLLLRPLNTSPLMTKGKSRFRTRQLVFALERVPVLCPVTKARFMTNDA